MFPSKETKKLEEKQRKFCINSYQKVESIKIHRFAAEDTQQAPIFKQPGEKEMTKENVS